MGSKVNGTHTPCTSRLRGPPAWRVAGVVKYVSLFVLLPIPVQEVPVHTIPLAITNSFCLVFGEPLFALGVCLKGWATGLFRNYQLLPF